PLGGRGSQPWGERGRSPSSQDDLGVGEVVVEGEAGQALKGLHVARARLGDDLSWELRTGCSLVPAEPLAVVPDVLLVEGRLRTAGGIDVRGPEARRVWSERLVAEHEVALLVEPELELRVGDDDAAFRCVFGCVAVELEDDALDLREPLFADELRRAVAVDVFVVPRLGLRRGSEDRSGEPIGFPQTDRELVPGGRARRAVVLPAGTGEIPADDA